MEPPTLSGKVTCSRESRTQIAYREPYSCHDPNIAVCVLINRFPIFAIVFFHDCLMFFTVFFLFKMRQHDKVNEIQPVKRLQFRSLIWIIKRYYRREGWTDDN
jgi:hypothetical protein